MYIQVGGGQLINWWAGQFGIDMRVSRLVYRLLLLLPPLLSPPLPLPISLLTQSKSLPPIGRALNLSITSASNGLGYIRLLV